MTLNNDAAEILLQERLYVAQACRAAPAHQKSCRIVLYETECAVSRASFRIVANRRFDHRNRNRTGYA